MVSQAPCWHRLKVDNCGNTAPLRRGSKRQWLRKIPPAVRTGYGFTFLSAMLLEKPPFVDLQNALFILRVFHTVSLVNSKLILYQVKDSNGLVLMEFTGLIMFPTVLKQLA